MATTLQIKRRIGTAGTPTALAAGELAFHDTGGSTALAELYVGTTGPTAVKTLVSSTRQVEIATVQTITAAKTFDITVLKLLGGASSNILTTDGAGNLSWEAAPGGGIVSVSHDATLSGNGAATPLSVVSLGTAQNISLQATGGTTITITPASFNGTAAALMTGFEITNMDCGTY